MTPVGSVGVQTIKGVWFVQHVAGLHQDLHEVHHPPVLAAVHVYLGDFPEATECGLHSDFLSVGCVCVGGVEGGGASISAFLKSSGSPETKTLELTSCFRFKIEW